MACPCRYFSSFAKNAFVGLKGSWGSTPLVDKKDIEGLFSLDVLLGGFTYERIQQRKDNES